jgi:protein TonB
MLIPALVLALVTGTGCSRSAREQELESRVDTLTNQVEELRARLNAQLAQQPSGPTPAMMQELEQNRQILESQLSDLDGRAKRLEEFNEAMFGQYRESVEKATQLEQGINASNTRLDRVEFQFSKQMDNVEGRMASFVEENLARAREFAELKGEVRRLMDAGNQPPRLIKSVTPEFPNRLRREGMNGEVELVFVVDELGDVIDPRVTRSTHSLFTASALKAVRQWKYSPALQNNQPTAAYVTQVVSYKIESK